jgi:oxidoreductase
MMSSRLCLVTGASGFLGSHLVDRLLREGASVRCLVRSTSKLDVLSSMNVELLQGDLTDEISLRAAVDGCDTVFHCGAMVSDWGTGAEIWKTNVIGTSYLLKASSRSKVKRFVHVSTTDVYGYPDALAVDESAPYAKRFCNWYSHSKAAADRLVMQTHERGHLETTVLRPATIYGPRSWGMVAEIGRALKARQMLMVREGNADAGLCYVENLVDAIMLAAQKDEAQGQAFNVTDGLFITWRQFLEDLAAGIGAPKPQLSLPYPIAFFVGTTLELVYRGLRKLTGLQTRPLLSRQAVHVMGTSQAFSAKKIQQQLNHQTTLDYASGLQHTVAWLLQTL